MGCGDGLRPERGGASAVWLFGCIVPPILLDPLLGGLGILIAVPSRERGRLLRRLHGLCRRLGSRRRRHLLLLLGGPRRERGRLRLDLAPSRHDAIAERGVVLTERLALLRETLHLRLELLVPSS